MDLETKFGLAEIMPGQLLTLASQLASRNSNVKLLQSQWLEHVHVFTLIPPVVLRPSQKP